MKNLIFIIAIFSSISLFSQDYTPMLVEGKTWDMKRTTYMVPPTGTTEIIYFSYYIEGTQIINSQEYFILKNNADWEIEHYLREDTNTKKVYEYFMDTETEQVLFDFNAEVGDSFTCVFQFNGWVFCNEGESTTEVIEIGNTVVFGESRKYYSVNILDEYNEVWGNFTVIEGVGFSDSGLFSSNYPNRPTDLSEYSLLSLNAMGIKDLKKSNTISISFQKEHSLLILKGAQSSCKLEVYSTTGRKVIDTTIKDVVSTSLLEKGVYVYHLTSGNAFSTGKILIY